MKYGVAVVSPRVAIRSILYYFQSHPARWVLVGVSFIIYLFLFIYLKIFVGEGGGSFLGKGGLFPPGPIHTQTRAHAHTCSSGIEEGYQGRT